MHVLIVEDSEHDAALLELELKRAGYQPVCQRVDKAEDMRAALQRQAWDLAIADYVLPHFSGLEALGVVKQLGLDLPFVIVSGHVTDDTAVAAMKAGAHDYVMKDNLARLGPAVERELREAEVRRARRRSEEHLKLEHAFRNAIENSVPCGIAVVDLEGRQTYVNPAFCAMVQWPEADLVGKRPPFVYWPAEEAQAITGALGRVIQNDALSEGVEVRFCRRNQERFHALLQVTPLRDSFGNVTGWVSAVSDITERKQAEIRLAAEHAITRILANAESLLEAAPAIVQVLLDSLEVEFGALWVVDTPHQVLQPAFINLRSTSPQLKRFLEESRRLSFPRGPSVLGRVWERGQTIWLPDFSQDPGFQYSELAAKAGLHSLMAFPIQSAGDFFGVLEMLSARFMPEDQRLFNMMTAIGSEIGQFVQRRAAEAALRHAHNELEVRVQHRTAELRTANQRLQDSIAARKRLENELLEITEKERRRIGLDLHDDLGQKLSGIALMTKGLELKLARQQARETEEAARIHGLVQEAMSHASDLAHDLATLELEEQELPVALAGLAAHVRELFGVQCRFRAIGECPALEATLTKQLYKIAQEAVTNAIKHGKAKRVSITLAAKPDALTLQVKNDGLPFPDLKGHSTGMGLRIMNYRASLVGGSLEIAAAGTQGTELSCTVPLEAKK